MARLASVAAVAALVAIVAAVNPMPYRPGYGLGSFVPDAVVNSMRREADVRSQMLLLSNLDNDAEALAREIQLASAPMRTSGAEFATQHLDPALSQDDAADAMKNIQKTRAKLWEMKLAAFGELTKQIEEQVASLSTASAAGKTGEVADGSFTTFASSVESAVDWGVSVFDNVELAFDSINLDVEFIRAEKNDQDGGYSSHVAAVNKYLENFTRTTDGNLARVQSAAARKGQDQMNSFSTKYQIEGTLVVRSFATHRNVLHFKRLDINADRLWRAWNYMRPNDRVADPLNQHDDFSRQIREQYRVDPSTADRINMVSEMFKGSAIVGLVHFVNITNARMNDTLSVNRVGAMSGAFTAEKVMSAQDRTYNSTNSSRANELISRLAKMGSNAGLEVHFSLACVGYIPTITTSQVQLSVAQMVNFDPANFKVPAMDFTDGTSMLGAVQSNMKTVIGTTIDSVARVDEASRLKVLDASAFMDAFTDFTKAAQDPERSKTIGAPTGFNMRTFTKLDVLSALANKYLNTGVTLAVDVTTDNEAVPPPKQGA